MTNLRHIEETHQHNWATRMRQLLLATCREVADAETRTLSEVRFEKMIVHYRSILKEGRKELPSRPSRKVKRAVCPYPRRKNCSMHSSSARIRSYALPRAARCRSPIIVASATFEWRKSSRKCLARSETSLTLMIIAELPATGGRCHVKVATRLPPYRSHSTAIRLICSTTPNKINLIKNPKQFDYPFRVGK